jgi:hypothetical protein
MANFNTHLSVAAIASGLLATVTLKMDLVFESEAVLLTFLGTLGGILPDIDLKYSHPSRIIFSFLGIIAAFATVFAFQEQYAIIELWMSATGVFLLVRYPLWMLFHHYTTHRGAIHSIATAVLFLFITTLISYHGFQQTAFIAWLTGFYIFFGFIIHLLLDELYSVDFVGNTLKRSFGSAMKIIDTKQWISSVTICSLALACWFAHPIQMNLPCLAIARHSILYQPCFFPKMAGLVLS